MTAIIKRVAELLPGPAKVAVDLLVDTLGPPDLLAAAVSALQEDVVRLHELMAALGRRLSAEMTMKMDPAETFELVTQTVSNMGRTASRERRRLMANVLVNGLEDVEADRVERRLFVRAVADLDVAHVDLLSRLAEVMSPGREWDPAEHDRVLAYNLLQHGLLVDHDPFVFDGEGFGHGTGSGYGNGDGSGSGGFGRQAHVSERGHRFLAYLSEPNEGGRSAVGVVSASASP